MSNKVKIALGAVGGVIVLILVVIGGGVAWAKMAVSSTLATTWDTHEVDFPIPFPLTEDEIEELRQEKLAELEGEAEGADPADDAPAAAEGDGEAAEAPDPLEGVDLDAIALERAKARGKHLVEGVYACAVCHADDFTGAVMVDDGAIGTWLGPNITTGGKTKDYAASDWDRAVRHGVKPDNTTSIMPSEDFILMSDRELSDIAAYITSLPPSDVVQPDPVFGPLGTFLIAAGTLQFSATKMADHQAAHVVEPPATGPTAEYGEHIIQVCRGCHRENLEGGPMPFGPPDWPPAANLTMHEDGLAKWTFEDFERALLESRRPDGTDLRMPMTEVQKIAANGTTEERQAMWAYLQSVEPVPTGE